MPLDLGLFPTIERHSKGRYSRHLLLPNLSERGPDLGFYLIGTTDELELGEADCLRLACHILIQRLGDQALAETMNSLVEIARFYAEPARPALPESEPVRVAAKYAGHYKAPSPLLAGGLTPCCPPPASTKGRLSERVSPSGSGG